MLNIRPTQGFRVVCVNCKRECIRAAKNQNRAIEFAKELGWTDQGGYTCMFCPSCSIDPNLVVHREQQ